MSNSVLAIYPVFESAVPAVFAGPVAAERRFWEFFVAQISNDHTRKAYFNAVRHFSTWCQVRGIGDLRRVEPMHIAWYLKALEKEGRAAPTIKLHLTALRKLFDWMVMGHLLAVNPALSVHGPRYVVRKGKTPVLTAEETRELLDSIKVARAVTGPSGMPSQLPLVTGLRDRAIISVMTFTFARISAVLAMKTRDYFVQGGSRWLRFHEKGGREHEVPCHHKLQGYLDEYISATGIDDDPDGPLFRTTGRKTGQQHAMWQQDAYRMIQRRARVAGIRTRISNHTFRATGITAFLRSGGRLEVAQQMAAHESSQTTQLYDRRYDEVTFVEVERIEI